MIRRFWVAIGVIAFSIAVLAAAYPGLVVLGLEDLLLVAIGVLALLLAVQTVRTRRRLIADRAEIPEPELPRPTPTPGDDLDEVLAPFIHQRGELLYPSQRRAALVQAAVDVLVRCQNVSRERARESVMYGTWTDDSVAAEYLSLGGTETTVVRDELRSLFSRSQDNNPAVWRRTIDAIVRATGEENEISSTEPIDRPRGALPGGDPDESGVVSVRETGHWYGVGALALVAIGIGVLVESGPVLIAGVVGVGFAAYARSSIPPDADLSIERTLSDGTAAPGSPIEVTVTLRNEGDRLIPDVRVVDGVPPALSVSAGTARTAAVLRAGQETSFTYTVTARRGTHSFGPTQVVARSITGSLAVELLLEAETTVVSTPEFRPVGVPVPLRAKTASYHGRTETDVEGDGIEFYATREYRRGDAVNRIDWNRMARTSDLATLEFRAERTATIVVVVDTRPASYRSAAPHDVHAVDRSVDAAMGTFTRLLDDGNRVGVAAFGQRFCWLEPDAGEEHRARARALFATHPSFSSVPGETKFRPLRWRRRFQQRLPAGAQVLYLTPLTDDYSRHVARQIDAFGYPVTVVSPDPTADRTSSHRIARVARTLRTADLRGDGIRVIDWNTDESLELAYARASERWSR